MNGSLLHTPMFRCLLAAGLALAASGPAFAAKQTQTADIASQTGPARPDAGPRCQGEAAKPASLTLQLGKSKLMHLPEQVQHRSVGNPAVVQALLVAPDTLYIAGVDVGSTNGTRVDGQVVTTHVLRPADTVYLGAVPVRFHVGRRTA